MASQFAEAYQSGSVQSFAPTSQATKHVSVAACYLRYSDTNSNTRSLNQQLINVLKKAERDGAFVPWQYVFADAAITATTTARPGYQMLRNLVGSVENTPSVIIVDELDPQKTGHIRWRPWESDCGRQPILPRHWM